MGADATIRWHVQISCSPGALFQQSVPKECLDRCLKKSAWPVTASITITMLTGAAQAPL
jgi:hypothetical protein